MLPSGRLQHDARRFSFGLWDVHVRVRCALLVYVGVVLLNFNSLLREEKRGVMKQSLGFLALASVLLHTFV